MQVLPILSNYAPIDQYIARSAAVHRSSLPTQILANWLPLTRSGGGTDDSVRALHLTMTPKWYHAYTYISVCRSVASSILRVATLLCAG